MIYFNSCKKKSLSGFKISFARPQSIILLTPRFSSSFPFLQPTWPHPLPLPLTTHIDISRAKQNPNNQIYRPSCQLSIAVQHLPDFLSVILLTNFPNISWINALLVLSLGVKSTNEYNLLADWNHDWQPGPYPTTPAERSAAAKKYGLREEDYEPYPEDGFGYGDYPKLPHVSFDSRSYHDDWDCPSNRRNYGEPVRMHTKHALYM